MDSRFSSDFEPSSLATGQTMEAATEAADLALEALVALDRPSTSVGVQECTDIDLGPDFGDRSSAGTSHEHNISTRQNFKGEGHRFNTYHAHDTDLAQL